MAARFQIGTEGMNIKIRRFPFEMRSWRPSFWADLQPSFFFKYLKESCSLSPLFEQLLLS